jgi:hypothetical protein
LILQPLADAFRAIFPDTWGRSDIRDLDQMCQQKTHGHDTDDTWHANDLTVGTAISLRRHRYPPKSLRQSGCFGIGRVQLPSVASRPWVIT